MEAVKRVMTPLQNLKAEIDSKVKERLLFVVMEEEKRLHGRRKSVECVCDYCKFLPIYVKSKIRYLRLLKRRFWVNDYYEVNNYNNCKQMKYSLSERGLFYKKYNKRGTCDYCKFTKSDMSDISEHKC